MRKFKYYKEGIVYANDDVDALNKLNNDVTGLWEEVDGLERWDNELPDTEQKYVNIDYIAVSSEYDKEQLLKAFKYIHDCLDIDTDYMAVNTIAHLYLQPNNIIVNEIPEKDNELKTKTD